MQPKILIGIVTYDKVKENLKFLLERIKQSKYTNKEIIIVDNSDKDELSSWLKEQNYKVIRDKKKEDVIDTIISGRNKIRKEFLESDSDYLLFLDSDVIPPEDIIEKITSHDKELVTGIYLGLHNTPDKKTIPIPMIFTYAADPKYTNYINIKDTLNNNLIPIKSAGLGCCLIKKEILNTIVFRRLTPKGGEDVCFFQDCAHRGYQAYADTSIKCDHTHYPKGDRRNEFLKWERYIK